MTGACRCVAFDWDGAWLIAGCGTQGEAVAVGQTTMTDVGSGAEDMCRAIFGSFFRFAHFGVFAVFCGLLQFFFVAVF